MSSPAGTEQATLTSPEALTSATTALQETQFHRWFPRFKRVSPKATVVNLSDLQPDFLSWFEEDGLRIPDGAEGVNGADPIQELGHHDASDNGSDPGSESSRSESDERRRYDFTELNRFIRSVLDKYDGRVFPKLNWSAPQDAGWMLPGNDLQAMSPADVYLLLKSSDFITNDIQQAQEIAAPSTNTADDGTVGTSSAIGNVLARPTLYLTLKKWFDMPPSHEFRLFVRANKLIAICQRDTVYYEHLQPQERQYQFIDLITSFWRTHLKRQTACSAGGEAAATDSYDVVGAPIPDYAADVYITRNLSSVFLIDINPYLPRTDALLFDWDELERLRFPEHFGGQVVGEVANPSLEAEASIALETRAESDDRPSGVTPPSPDGDSDPKPILRLIRSFAEQQAAHGAAPKYAANMIPKEALDPSAVTGEALVELAREIHSREQRGASGNHVPK